jgi:hypothetical protein
VPPFFYPEALAGATSPAPAALALRARRLIETNRLGVHIPRCHRGQAVAVLVFCRLRRHQREADLHALVGGGRGDVPLIRPQWKCSRCRSDHADFKESRAK